MLYAPAILLARLLRVAVRAVRPGGGSALPGGLLSRLAPNLLSKVLKSFPQGVVVVTGSAGKSTTTKMLVAIARAHGLDVFTNPSTANIKQGFYSSIVRYSDLAGRIAGDIAILEMDEGHAAETLRNLKVRQVTLLNVLEDQLDRFVDPSFVTAKLLTAAEAATSAVIVNADDQNLLHLLNESGSKLAEVSWFGIKPELEARSKRGLGEAPTYRQDLERPTVQTEIVDLQGKRAVLTSGQNRLEFDLPNRGLHFALDAAAAYESARRLLGERFNPELAVKTLDELPPVFARGEVAEVGGVKVEFNLVQNPTSFQLNLDNLEPGLDRILVAVGRDVHDPSWLWTVDFSGLSHADVVTGYNAAEIATRLHVAGVPLGLVDEDIARAWDAFMSLPEPTNGIRTVLFSADVMRRLRRHLGFTDPEAVTR